jgi:hypothetical protein
MQETSLQQLQIEFLAERSNSGSKDLNDRIKDLNDRMTGCFKDTNDRIKDLNDRMTITFLLQYSTNGT